jgi:GGDEF domain-containing protein
MKRHRSSLLSDSALLLFFILCFICIIFMQGEPDRYVQNVLFLNLSFVIAILAYFTSVTAGLVLNILFIFGYGTFILFQSVTQGSTIDSLSYFWLVMTPALTLASWMLSYTQKQLQAENEQLKLQSAALATLDEQTNLRNTRSFQRDATIFMALSNRYNIPLTLLVIGVRYWNDLSRLVRTEELAEMIHDVSKLSEESIRLNDSVYLLQTDNPLWGLLLFTDRDGAEVVIQRLKEKIVNFNKVEFAHKYKVELTLVTGAAFYENKTVQTPLEFIALARKQLEYDVSTH